MIDRADMALLELIRSLGMRAIVDDIVMADAAGETRVAESLVRALKSSRWLMRLRSNLFAQTHAVCSQPIAGTAGADVPGRRRRGRAVARRDQHPRGAMKTRNLRRNPRAAFCALNERFYGEWHSVEGNVEIIHLPRRDGPLVDYYRRFRRASGLAGISRGHGA